MEETRKQFKMGSLFDGLYSITNDGRLYSNRRNKFLRPSTDKYGYLYYVISIDGVRKTLKAHRLVAQAFIPNPKNKPQVNHIDSNRQNNNVKNLEWVTAKENIQHAVKNKRFENMAIINSERMKKSKLYLKGYPLANEVTKKKVAQYDKKNNLLNVYESISDASRNTGITITSISYACNNKRKTGGGFIWHFV